MYVVVNLPEIEYCTTEEDEFCPKDLAYYYNTNVVFNREGRIIARYKIKQTFLVGNLNIKVSTKTYLLISDIENLIYSENLDLITPIHQNYARSILILECGLECLYVSIYYFKIQQFV